MSAAVIVENLTKTFGDFRAVDEVSFKGQDGKITALLGPSGSGKSTVLRIIAGLEKPDSGKVTLVGTDQTDATVQERRVGFVFQHYALFRHMTVRQNVGFGLMVRKEPKADVSKRVDELLHLVQLGPFADRYPHNLSGGQRQRVALARALAPRPKVLLLDEPFGALDARVRQDLRHWLDELHRELGVTSILVTHDQEEALELADTIVLMHEGKIEQVGSPDEVYNNPATPFVAGFLGAANVLEGRVVDGQLRVGGQAFGEAEGIEEGVPAKAYVRPHDVMVSPPKNGRPVVSGTLERVNNLGWMSKLHVRFPDGQGLIAEVRNEELEPIEPGQMVEVDLRNAQVFPTTEIPDPEPEPISP
jgi:sulfate/thiosulfate transport system ATP-binding protein